MHVCEEYIEEKVRVSECVCGGYTVCTGEKYSGNDVCLHVICCVGKTDISNSCFSNRMELHRSLCGLLTQPAVRLLKHRHRRHREVGNSYTQ